jgi:hypothetical protein
MVVNEYQNTLILPLQYDWDILNIQTLPIGGGALAILGVSIPLGITLKRSGNSGTVGASPWRDATPSPRIGFSIGSSFKNQTYLRLDIAGYGFQVAYAGIQWVWTECIPAIETSSNCRLRRMYVTHGNLVSARIDTTVFPEKRYFKILDNSSPPPQNFRPGGAIRLYSKDGHSAAFTITSVNSDWEIVTDKEAIDRNGNHTPVLEVTPEAGMFFSLDKVWALEDPRLIHDYSLKADSGYYDTDAQRFLYSSPLTDVIGIWLPPSQTSPLYTLYIDQNNAATIPPPDTPYDASVSGESMSIGGSFSQGVNLFKSLVPQPQTVRVSMSGVVGSKSMQNACAGNLVGEHLRIGNDYYEITQHPRGDTVEVMNLSSTSANKFIDNLQKPIELKQQKYWMTTEVYPGNLVSGYPEGLWVGKVESVAQSQVAGYVDIKWGGFESQIQTATIHSEMTGSKTLVERYRNNASISAVKVANAFAKYAGWKVVNKTLGASRDVGSITFANNPFESQRLVIKAGVKAVLDDFLVGDSVYVVFGEQYQPAIGVAPDAVLLYRMQTRPAIGYDNQYRIWMNGYLDFSGYHIPETFPAGTKFSLVDFSYGGDFVKGNSHTVFGNPIIDVSTLSRMFGMSFMEFGVSRRQMLYFNDYDQSLVVFRQASPGWKMQIEQKALVVGKTTTINRSDDVASLGEKAFVTGVNIPTFWLEAGLSYWLMLKDNIYSKSLPYFSTKISGKGGVDTFLSRGVNATVDVTEKSPVYLPFEFYPVMAGSSWNASTLNYLAPAYYRKRSGSDEDLLKTSVETIQNNVKLNSLYAGEPVTAGIQVDTARSVEMCKNSQILASVDLFDAVAPSCDEIAFSYGDSIPESYSIGFVSSDITNKAMKAVFIISSQNSGAYWGSSKYKFSEIQGLSGEETPWSGSFNPLKVWSKPLVILPEFQYVQALLDKTTNMCLVFGFGYGRDGQQSGVAVNDLGHLFIGMYRFDYNRIRSSDVQPIYLADDDSGEAFAYYRDPKIKLDFGNSVSTKVPHNDGGALSDEMFVRIVGGQASGAAINNIPIAEELFSVGQSPSGTIGLFLRDVSTGNIVALESPDSGATWARVGTTLASGQAPYLACGLQVNHLFFFDGDVLKVKNVQAINSQDLLDAAPVVEVISGVPPQRVAAGVDKSGRLTVYYTVLDGYVSASESYDSGSSWKTLTNW